MSKAIELKFVFEGLPCKRCGSPVPPTLLACRECYGIRVEPAPSKRKPKAEPKEQQTSLLDAEYPA